MRSISLNEVFTPVGRRDPISVTDGVRGYEGTVSGLIQSPADLEAFENMKAACVNGGSVRLVMGDLNCPGQIGAVSIGRDPTEAGLYPVSFEFTQTAEFTVPLRAT